MKILKRIVKLVAAVLIFVVLFNSIQTTLIGCVDDRTPKRLNGFYSLEENTLDAVFIGSSATYATFISPYVWHEYGVAVYPFASQAQPIQAAKFIIEEGLKTQPDAAYIVNISSINGTVTKEWLHILFDNMPLSINKIKAVDYVCGSYGYTTEEKMEYIFPIIKFHDRWSDLNEQDFMELTDEYMSGGCYYSFLKLKKDVGTVGPLDPDPNAVIPENIDTAVEDLLDYVESENIKIQFVVTPQSVTEVEKAGVLRAVIDKVEARGFEVLDMRGDYEKVGIDCATDFYNKGHTNMHGAIKSSTYVTKHLIDKFGFEDKRGDSRYQVWEDAAEKYYKDCFVENLKEADLKYFTTDLTEYKQ